jgi:hypothetical protein
MPRFLKFISKPRFPVCSLCNEPVELETAKADEHGNSIHEECYVLGLIIKTASIPPRRTAIQLCPTVSLALFHPFAKLREQLKAQYPKGGH